MDKEDKVLIEKIAKELNRFDGNTSWNEITENHSCYISEAEKIINILHSLGYCKGKDVIQFIESYFVDTIESDGITMHHIDDTEWKVVKDKLW